MRAPGLQILGLTLAFLALAMQALAGPGVPCAAMARDSAAAPMQVAIADHESMTVQHAGHQTSPETAMHHEVPLFSAGGVATADMDDCCDHGDCSGSSCFSAAGALLVAGWSDFAREPRAHSVRVRCVGQRGHPGSLLRPPSFC